MRRVGLVVAVGLLAACSAPDPSHKVSGHQLSWQDHHPSSYEYTLTYGSMIGARYARIRVMDGRVVSVNPVEGEQQLIAPYDKALTIDGVFDLLRADQASADKVRTTYDKTWGFPASVFVDEEQNAIDDEHGYSVQQFIALSGPLPTADLTVDRAVATCRFPYTAKGKQRRVVFLKIGGVGQGDLSITDGSGGNMVAPRAVSPGEVDVPLLGSSATGHLRLVAGTEVLVERTLSLTPNARC